MADYADPSFGIEYPGGSLILFTALMIVLGLSWFSVNSVSFNYIASRKVEIFYWVTMLFSNTTCPLGATGDDLLTKPVAHGGLNLSRISSSLLIATFTLGCILFASQKAGGHPGEGRQRP